MFSKAPASVNDHLRFYIGFVAIALLPLCARAQQANEVLSSATLKEQIAGQRQAIELATTSQLSNDRLGYLWAVLAATYRRDGDFSGSESAYVKALDLQRDLPSAQRNYATTLDNFGMLYLLYGRLDEAERYNRMGAKVRTKMGYRLDRARSEEHLAEIDLAKHRFKQADAEAESALRVMRAENDPETLDLIGSLNALAYTRCLRGRCAEGVNSAKESVELARQRYGERSMAMAHSLMASGFASWKSGMLHDAEPEMRSAIEIMQSQPLPGRVLLMAMVQYRNYLREMQRACDAETVDRQLLTAQERIGRVCADCINVRSLVLR